MKEFNSQKFFKYRMTEIFHKDTLDSYRVRTNNAMTILLELKTVLISWIKGRIKRFQTVELCLQECTEMIKLDKHLNYEFYDKDLFIKEINDFISIQKKSNDPLLESTNRLLFFVRKCIDANDSIYLNELTVSIEKQLLDEKEIKDDQFMPFFNNLNSDISAFACELLRKGYSKIYLYKFFRSFKKNPRKVPFKDAFIDLKAKLINNQRKNFTVAFKLDFQTEKLAQKATIDLANIKNNIPENLKLSIKKELGYKNPGSNTRFYITTKDAFDSAMAAMLCYDELSKDFDFNLDSIKSVEMPQNALTFCKKDNNDNEYVVQLENIYILDKVEPNNDKGIHELYTTLKNIEKNRDISEDVKDRISASIRHLRIGDYQNEIEQQFINYWIGLEFIFASASSKESTYERIKKFLIQASECCYIKRNILYLNNWLIEYKVIEKDDKYWERTDKIDLINSLENVLLKYRLKKMESHLHHSDTIKEYIRQHKTNLEQHISRIYRLRNELIHEAAIKQDMANVTSNLRSYLVFILNQLISFFSKKEINMESKTMLHFFLNFEIHLKLIEKYHNIQSIMDAPLAKELIH